MKKTVSLVVALTVCLSSGNAFILTSKAQGDSGTDLQNATDYINAVDYDSTTADESNADFVTSKSNGYLEGACSWKVFEYECLFSEVPDYVEIDMMKTWASNSGEFALKIKSGTSTTTIASLDAAAISACTLNERTTVTLPIDSSWVIDKNTKATLVMSFAVANFRIYGIKFVKSNELKLKSVTPSNKSEIDIFLGEIVLQFNEEIDDTTIEGKISFTDEDGFEPTGGVHIDCVGKEVKLTFGNLKYSTDYKLEILSGISSLDGRVLAQPTEMIYTTNTSADNVYIDDFSSGEYVIGQKAPENSFLTYSVGSKQTNEYTLVSQINGMKYISISSTKNKSGMAKLKLDDIDDEYYIIKYKVRSSSSTGIAGSASRSVGIMLGSDLTKSSVVAKLGTEGLVKGNTSGSSKYEGELSYANTDSNGFTDVELYIKKVGD